MWESAGSPKRTKPAGGGGSGGLHYDVPAREEDLPELSRDVGGGYIRADLENGNIHSLALETNIDVPDSLCSAKNTLLPCKNPALVPP